MQRQKNFWCSESCLKSGSLDEVSNVHGHLLDLSAVELFNLSHHSDVLRSDKVDCNTLSAETTASSDTVDVVLAVSGQVIVDDQRDLLHIDTSGKKIGSNQDTRRSRTELLHNQVTLSLVHVTVHGRHGEVTGGKLVGKPVDLSASVAENDSLGDGDRLVQVGKSIKLPLFLLHSNVELLNTLKGELVLLYENTDGVTHELGGDLEHVLRHGGGQQNDLSGLGK